MPLALPAHRAVHHLTRLRERAPLVHIITNDVVTGFTANVLLALGAAPAMITAVEEVAEFARIAQAVSLNVGTLTAPQADAMRLAALTARDHSVPWVLDPVAAGALGYRTTLCKELLALRPAAIRGNAAEIMALAGTASRGRGVDSLNGSEEALDAAQRLASSSGAIVAVTGATDYICDGDQVIAVHSGDPLMTRVTGTGCALSTVVAAFLATGDDPLHAVASACAVMGVAGKHAARQAKGPGSFVPLFLDGLYAMDAATLEEGL